MLILVKNKGGRIAGQNKSRKQAYSSKRNFIREKEIIIKAEIYTKKTLNYSLQPNYSSRHSVNLFSPA